MVYPINGSKVPQRGATHEVEGILRIVEGKASKFQEGLLLAIQSRVAILRLTWYVNVVDQALIMEREFKELMKSNPKRSRVESSQQGD
ncbi:hypothetical protein CK203_045829 [Vitis vinifera]|uniref:Uncharacterized protein n=1 Tax=Vitis vinifera TaxID=29760 RepID=A0A438FLY3_VITVI|nr:hypothetical protein CK203_045829 [Vitis vinifera]